MADTGHTAGTHRRRRLAVAGILTAAMLAFGIVGVRATNHTDEWDIDEILVNGELPSLDDIDLSSITLESAVAAIEAVTGANISPIEFKVPGIRELGPLRIPASKVTVDYLENTLTLRGGVNLDTGDGAPKQVALSIRAVWDDFALDEIPTINVAADGTAAPFDVADVLYLADGLVPGAAATAEELTTSLGVDDFRFSFVWDNPATGAPAKSWFDVTGNVVIAPADPERLGDAIEFGFLFSRDSREGADPVTVYGFKTRSADPQSNRIDLSGLFDGPFGEIAGNLNLPEVTLATARGLGSGESLKLADLRLGIPQAFFLDCGPACSRQLPSDFTIDPTLTLMAQFRLDSLGEAARDTFGFAAGDTVDLYGKLGFTMSSFEKAEPVDLDQLTLRATIPSPVNSTLPDFFQTGDWTFGLEYLDADATIETFAETSIVAEIPDATQAGGVHAAEFQTKATMLYDIALEQIDLELSATSTSSWVAPYGVNWITLDAVGITGGTLTDTDGTAWDIAFTSAFELCAERTGAACDSGIDAVIEARLGGDGPDAAASFRIGLGDEASDSVPMAALYDAIASEFAETPDLGPVANALILEQFSLALEVDSNANVLFESRATVSLDFCAATPKPEGGCHVDLDLGTGTMYFFLEQSDSGDLVFFLGARPDLENVSLSDIVAAPGLEDMTLPGIGLILTTAELDRESDLLSRDGYEFFRPLFGVAEDVAQGDPGSDFTVELKPGANLVANIAIADAPAPLIELLQNLWIDVTRGIQFKGAVGFPGLGVPNAGELSLELLLPRVLPPRQVDFIEEGSLRLGVSIDPKDLKVKLFVLGTLDTRFRVDGVEITESETCDVGSNELSFKRLPEDAPDGKGAIVDAYYCYHRLRFEIETAVTLSTSGLEVTLTGSLIGQDGGWEAPFGIEWLTLKRVTLQFGIRFKPPECQPCFSFGFLGNIVVGDSDNPNESTEILIAADIGIKVLPPSPPFGQPTPVPEFNGFRGFFSRLGMSDIARLQAMIAGDAAPLDFGTLPDLEVRGGEIMIALRDNEALCLQQGIGIAGELWINPDPNAVSEAPEVPEGNCIPFGGFTDPAACADRKDEGCFASIEMLLTLTDISASGALVGFDLGPIVWDDALVEFRLSPTQQLLAASGGVTIDGLAQGNVAFRLTGLPAPKVDFYGNGRAFDEFLVILDGSLGIDFESLSLDDLEVFSLHAVLQSDFDAFMRSKIEPALVDLQQSVAEIQAVWDTLNADPFEQIIGLPAALQAIGVTPDPWVDELANQAQIARNALNSVGASAQPDLGLFFNGGTFVTTAPKTACGFGQYYDAGSNTCRWWGSDDLAGQPGCPLLWEDVGSGCTYSLVIPSLADLAAVLGFEAPPSLTAALSELEGWLEDAVESAIGFASGKDLDEYFGLLVDSLTGDSLVSVSCAEFDFTGGSDSTVGLRLKLSLLGEEYGFGLDMDLSNPLTATVSIIDSLIAQYLAGDPEPVSCTGDVEPQFEVEAAPDRLTVDLGLDATAIDEGSLLGATVTFNRAPEADVTVTWGDGSSDVFPNVSDTALEISHIYVDDFVSGGPSGTAADAFTVGVSVSGDAATDSKSVLVRNVAPVVTIVSTPDVDEAGSGELVVTVGDPGTGANETFTANINWGDGHTETLAVDRSFTRSHTYADDDPSGTSVDAPTITVRVTDDDGGRGAASATATVRNVSPEIPDATVDALEELTVKEGVPATFPVSFADIGTLDQHLVRVQWSDGTAESRVELRNGERATSFVHTFADDDPTGTNGDTYAIRVSVADDDRGGVTRLAGVFVQNVPPAVSLPGGTSIEVQYSDPIEGGLAVAVTATDVTPDVLTASTAWRAQGAVATTSIPAWLQLTSTGCNDLGTGYATCGWDLEGVADPVSGIHTDIAPGIYELIVTITDDDGGSSSATLVVTVKPEDARIWYDGPQYAATTSANSGTATLELRATLRDISSLPEDESWDPWPGDVREAEVAFVDRDAGTLCSDPTIELVFPGDVSIGVPSCEWEATLNKSEDALVVSVGSVVGGHYVRNHGDDDTVVTVARPIDEFITGGGHVVIHESAGVYAADPGSKANFGFAVKFNKRGTNLQGRVTIIVRQNGTVYQIRSNALDSLGVNEPWAEFEAKANLTDVTDPAAPASLGGNLVLQMTLTDGEESGSADEIGFTLWDIKKNGNRFLLFSSHWDGNQTQQQALGGGNVVVHGR